jgi:ribosomal protein RSM22 (predicted rRNA methylase)
VIDLPEELADALRAVEPQSASLQRAARRLSDTYRSGRPAKTLHRDDAIAYALYRMPATYAACVAALSAAAAALPAFAPASLLDFGAGPGTAAWAATRVFASIRDVTLVERDEEMQVLGRELASAHPVLSRATWRAGLSGGGDLVVAAYALGESPAAGDGLWEATEGALVVVEPGTPRGYATVIGARSTGISRGGHAAAPCPHDRACPMTVTRQWCHFAERLPRTALHRALKQASLPWEDEKFSYVALCRAEPARAPARVVGRPRYGKHLVRLPLCAPDGLVEEKVGASSPRYRRARGARWGGSFDYDGGT